MLQKMNEKNTCPSESTINISQNQSKKAKIVTNPIAGHKNHLTLFLRPLGFTVKMSLVHWALGCSCIFKKLI